MVSGEAAFLAVARTRGLRPPTDRFVRRSLRRLSAFFAAALLREGAAARSSPLAGIQARARILATLLFLVSVSLARSLPSLCLHALVPLAVLALARLRPREILVGGLLPALVFTLVMAAPATLSLVHPGHVVLPIVSLKLPGALRTGPVDIAVTHEGLLSAATLLLRVAVSVSMVLWLTFSTRWVELLRALRGLYVPPVIIQVAGMTVRYLHALLRQAEEAHLGRRSRMIGRRPLHVEQAWAGSRIAVAWQRALYLAEDVGQAMTARGFTGEIRLPAAMSLALADWLFLGAVALACLVSHAC